MIGSGILRTTNGESWHANEYQLVTCLYRAIATGT